MSPRWWSVAVAAAGIMGLAALLWRWHGQHVGALWAAAALLVLAGIPAMMYLVPNEPSRTPHRFPTVFWIGCAMLAVGVLSTSALGVSGQTQTVGISSVSVSSGKGPTLRKVAVPPRPLVQAVRQVFPGSRVAAAFTLAHKGAVPAIWEVLIGDKKGLIAEAVWDGNTLTLSNLDWNRYFTGTTKPQKVYSWTKLWSEVRVPKHAKVLGPYVLPGYYVMVVPSLGQIWDLNDVTGATSGGEL